MTKKHENHNIAISSAPPGSYAILIGRDNHALVLPVVAFLLTESENGCPFITPLVTDSHGYPLKNFGPVPVDLLQRAEWWKAFAPGENGLRWAEAWQEATGRKIEQWDVSVWWPSKAPLFATADETLWSDDFIPPAPAG